MQLFLDLDGVLADFDRHHEAVIGFRPDKMLGNVDWSAVRASSGFYADLPPIADAFELWNGVRHLGPIILTGVPHSVEEPAADKRYWVRSHLGEDVEVRCCCSFEKCLHARPGDILVDDWEKYRRRWDGAGGIWVTHTGAAATLRALADLGVL